MFILLQINFYAVQFKQATFPHLADLAGVEELELAGTFVVVILDGDAAVPFLDFARACPETDVNRLRTVEHQTSGRYVNGLHLVVWVVALSSSLFDCKDKKRCKKMEGKRWMEHIYPPPPALRHLYE